MYQIVKMSDDEKKVMYKKLTKDKLIEMLISANNNIELLTNPLKTERIVPDVSKEEQTNVDDIIKDEDKSMNYILIFSSGILTGLLIGYFYWFN